MALATFSFNEELHVYRDEYGVAVVSTTQVLKAAGLISFDGVPFRVLEHKRQLGQLVHKAAQLLDEGEDLEQYDIPEECLPYLEGYRTFRRDCGFSPELIEHRMLVVPVSGMRWGMTLDRTGDINGVKHIIELKCGSSSHPAWSVQLASYDIGLSGSLRPKLARAVVQLGPEFSRGYKVHPYTDPADYVVWMNSLYNTIWMQNHNLYQFEAIEERLEA